VGNLSPLQEALQRVETRPVILPADYATIFDCSVNHVYQQMARGRIDAIKIGNCWRIMSKPIRARLGMDGGQYD
jgi:hypothetical protein